MCRLVFVCVHLDGAQPSSARAAPQPCAAHLDIILGETAAVLTFIS